MTLTKLREFWQIFQAYDCLEALPRSRGAEITKFN